MIESFQLGSDAKPLPDLQPKGRPDWPQACAGRTRIIFKWSFQACSFSLQWGWIGSVPRCAHRPNTAL